MEYQWETIIERLAFHRQRLFITKPEMIKYIKQKYNKNFSQLTDNEVIELGQSMAKSTDKFDFLVQKKSPEKIKDN
jgi:hypothetical protein